MMSSGGLTSAGLFAGKRRDPVQVPPAAVGSRRMQRTGINAGVQADHWASTWAAPRPTSPILTANLRARVRDRSRGRAHARADEYKKIAPSPRAAARFSHSTARAFASVPLPPAPIPDPAAGRRGGPLTVTDANLMTGKLIPDLFPKVFGPQSDEPLDDEISTRAVCGARARHRRRTGAGGGRRRFSRHRGCKDGRGDQDDFGCAGL